MSRSILTGRRVAVALGAAALLLVVHAAESADSPAGARVQPPQDQPRWIAHVESVDAAIGRGDASGALRAWHSAYTAALGSRTWEGMLDVGAAYLRIGELTRSRHASGPKARELYLSALIRARAQKSVDGLVRVADAFGELGDREVVDQCLRVASDIAGNDPDAARKVNVARARWTEPTLASPTLPYR